MAAYTRCLRCAGAPRRPASGSELSLHIPSWHAVLSDPGGVQHRYVPELRCRHGLRRLTTGSALPKFPQSVPRGLLISWLHWFASATACQVARPPVRIRLDRPAFGDFYFQAFNGSVSLSVAGYNYNSGWISLCWRDLHPLEWQLASLHGQNAKYSARADLFRSSPKNGHWFRHPTQNITRIESYGMSIEQMFALR